MMEERALKEKGVEQFVNVRQNFEKGLSRHPVEGEKRVRREVADVMRALDKLVNRHRWNVLRQS